MLFAKRFAGFVVAFFVYPGNADWIARLQRRELASVGEERPTASQDLDQTHLAQGSGETSGRSVWPDRLQALAVFLTALDPTKAFAFSFAQRRKLKPIYASQSVVGTRRSFSTVLQDKQAGDWQKYFVQPGFDSYAIFESPHSSTVIGMLKIGDCVLATRKPEEVNGYQMVMLMQGGAVDMTILSEEVSSPIYETVRIAQEDVGAILSKEPDWTRFSEDFELVDQQGSKFGMGFTKTFLKYVRKFTAKFVTEETSVVDVGLAADDNSTMVITGNFDLHGRGLPFPLLNRGFDLSVRGKTNITVDEQGKMVRGKIESLFFNGRDIGLPRMTADDFGNLSLTDKIRILRWTRKAILGAGILR